MSLQAFLEKMSVHSGLAKVLLISTAHHGSSRDGVAHLLLPCVATCLSWQEKQI